MLPSPGASASHPSRVDAPHVTVSLVSEVSSVQPGTPFAVGLRFELEDDWHVYWKNPGDSGMKPGVEWTLPAGYSAAALSWPAPARIAMGPLVNFGYEGDVLLPAEMRPAAQPSPGPSVNIRADVSWLVCKIDCVPGWATLGLTLPQTNGAPELDESVRPIFDSARDALPLPLSSSPWQVSAGFDDSAIVFELRPERPGRRAQLSRLEFFPDLHGLIHNAGEQRLESLGDRWLLRVPRPSAGGLTLPDRIDGVLVSDRGWRGSGSERALRVELAWQIDVAALDRKPRRESLGPSLWIALVGAFVGGLILNLMPCVLPILSIKVLGFVESAKSDMNGNPKRASAGKKAALRHALVFTFGVLASFWLLAGGLLALRAVGHELGWGFQLQSPFVVVGLAVLFLLMALHLFGVFEFGTRLVTLAGRASTRSGRGSTGAFASGVLATIVATPCTAPFMGTALGYALVQPAVVALVVFTALGAGMAAPYVLLAANPRLLRRVPKPGPWMETLRQLLGFFMLASVVWLLWVFGHQAVPDDASAGSIDVIGEMTRLVAGLLFVALGGWAWGRAGRSASRAVRTAGATAALAALVCGIGLPWAGVRSGEAAELDWQRYDPQRIAELEARGEAYFIDFTASWCLSCQVNKALALDRTAVARAFRRRRVTPFIADWTNQDRTIAAALASYGRYSVPLYVLQPGTRGREAIILPNLLTEGIVLDALNELHNPDGPGFR
ncbi:MAG: thioredoxin family protein [Acidobacteriota bacterium]|nr:MAG: thioredoxin family protein [Acidobacteriota bacterium]